MLFFNNFFFGSKNSINYHCGGVAQSVEQRDHNPLVGGSSPFPATKKVDFYLNQVAYPSGTRLDSINPSLMSDIIKQSFAKELINLVEAGINKHLKSSIKYSPLKIAFGLFKKSNPNTVQQVRAAIIEDCEEMLRNITDYSEKEFLYNGEFTKKGQMARKIAYNIGINLLKKELNVRTAFKATRNQEVRERIYSYIFLNLRESIDFLISKEEKEFL